MANIHKHAERGYIRAIAKEIKSGVNVDSRDKEYPATPLAYAAYSENANLEMMAFLLEKGADVNARAMGTGKSTVLSFAIRSGNIAKIEFLLNAGADLDYQSPYNSTALVDAVRSLDRNLIEVLEFLIVKGCRTDRGTSHVALLIASRRGRFDAVNLLLDAGGDVDTLQWDSLMQAVALGSLADVQTELASNPDLTVRDYEERTPFLLSLAVGNLAKAKLILAAGGNLSDRGKRNKTPLMYAVEPKESATRIELLNWLIELGCTVNRTNDLEAKNKSGMTILAYAAALNLVDCVALLLDNNANPNSQDIYECYIIEKTCSIGIVRMLQSYGATLDRVNQDVRDLLRGVYQRSLKTTKEDYLVGKHRIFGKTNPEVMQVNFWSAMIRSNYSAGEAREEFGDMTSPESDRHKSQPVWSFDRFGRTITELPNGKIVEIGGEHEDSYDPDFCIYNDVVVYDGRGNFQLFGYPREVFPPTDFHTATLIGDYIYIIGNLGYTSDRLVGDTQVYRLNWHNWQMEKATTAGNKPGWISRHLASYRKDSIIISGGKVWTTMNGRSRYIKNDRHFCLNLIDLCWISID